jgi:NADH-quinone oxidoreductase subunit L
VPALPAAGFVLLLLLDRRLGRRAAGVIGVGAIALSFVAAGLVAIDFLTATPEGDAYRQVLWTWFSVAGFAPRFALYLDAMSLVFMLVVTFVGTLIFFYSTEYMGHDDDFTRFFMYMNLFVASMLLLVLADDLLVLLIGWEGVGLCSYLLIGFWYRDPQNGYAARKAFIVTRVGDTAMLVALFLLVAEFGTLRIQPVMQQVSDQWETGSAIAVATALLLLGGAVGKSAQLPLQTWLPDAMAGPTPVSALIHAATMVTAGVYLIARTNAVFLQAPEALAVVAIVGALTLLYAGLSALAQTDIKRILAYSTISQIGYMFLALGIFGWGAAIFHFMTHAFFKALLFLAAGSVIEALGGEQDVFRMGGLRRRLRTPFWAFVVGSASLAALPFVTAGFYSKDLIIEETLASVDGGVLLWLAAIIGTFITGVYSFRLVYVVFYGEERSPVVHDPGLRMKLPLWTLMVLSTVSGFLWMPWWLGGFKPFAHFIETALPHPELIEGTWRSALWVQWIAPETAIAGLLTAWLLWRRRPDATARFTARPAPNALGEWWRRGWGFDWLYDQLVVRPVRWFARAARDDLVEPVVAGIAWVHLAGWRLLSRGQSGLLRSYVAVTAVGVVVILVLVIWR